MGKTKRQKISSLATKMRMLLIKKNGMFERNKRSKINEKKECLMKMSKNLSKILDGTLMIYPVKLRRSAGEVRF